MRFVRKLLSGLSMVAVVGLVLIGVAALVTLLVRYPARIAIGLGVTLVATVVLGAVARPLAPRVKKGTILEMDLKTIPVESGSTSRLAALQPSKGLTLGETIETLERAARDKRVAGLVLRPRFLEAPSSVVDELRAAIVAFGDTGKFTIAVADTYGEGVPALGAYALATACRTVTVQETGNVGIGTLSMESNFYPDLLARLGISIEVFGRGKYKSAPNKFTMKKFTAADTEQRQRLLDSIWDHQLDQIATARKLAPRVVRSLAEKGSILAAEALEEGLVDRVAYPDQVIEDAKASVGKKSQLLYLHLYKKRAGKGRTSGKSVEVAVIRASGEIRRDASALPVGLGGMSSTIAPDTLVPHIRAAVKDKKVKAVVLRIDSPGGSALASDSIWRELGRVREAGKPLVASMSSVAASGGYYLAAPADKIIASPTTITGSIGVFGMLPMIAGAKKKLSIHTDELHTGDEPGMSFNRPLTKNQRQRIDESIDATYDTFLNRVADGRNMAVDDVFEVAQGRVWTGADAVEAGLVDELGGLDHAVAVAVGLTGAAAGTRAKVKTVPKKSKGVGALKRNKGDSSDDVAAAAASISLTPALLEGLSGVQAHLGCDPRRFWLR